MDYVNAYVNGSESEKIELLKELAVAANAFKAISDLFKSEHDVGDYNGVKVSVKTITDYSPLISVCEAKGLSECLEVKVKATEAKKAVKAGLISKEEFALCATSQTKVLSVKESQINKEFQKSIRKTSESKVLSVK